MKKFAYLLIGAFLLCSCSGDRGEKYNSPVVNETSADVSITKSSPVKRVKITQRLNGDSASSFVCAILLEDGKVFGCEIMKSDRRILEAGAVCKLSAKDLFILEVGDVVTYSGDKIVKIDFQ